MKMKLLFLILAILTTDLYSQIDWKAKWSHHNSNDLINKINVKLKIEEFCNTDSTFEISYLLTNCGDSLRLYRLENTDYRAYLYSLIFTDKKGTNYMIHDIESDTMTFEDSKCITLHERNSIVLAKNECFGQKIVMNKKVLELPNLNGCYSVNF